MYEGLEKGKQIIAVLPNKAECHLATDLICFELNI
jgi:hypothetical protein